MNLIKEKVKAEKYNLIDGFYILRIEQYGFADFYMGHFYYGDLMYMFGVNANGLYDEVLSINALDYIERYKELITEGED